MQSLTTCSEANLGQASGKSYFEKTKDKIHKLDGSASEQVFHWPFRTNGYLIIESSDVFSIALFLLFSFGISKYHQSVGDMLIVLWINYRYTVSLSKRGEIATSTTLWGTLLLCRFSAVDGWWGVISWYFNFCWSHGDVVVRERRYLVL